jgi:hypothetical protein
MAISLVVNRLAIAGGISHVDTPRVDPEEVPHCHTEFHVITNWCAASVQFKRHGDRVCLLIDLHKRTPFSLYNLPSISKAYRNNRRVHIIILPAPLAHPLASQSA